MKAENALWGLAVACAALLLLAPATPRTRWVHPQGWESSDFAGWAWMAFLAGLVAMAALALGRWLRPDVRLPAGSAAIAALAFTATAAVSTSTWLSFRRGAFPLSTRQPYPAPAVPFFVVIALIGLLATLLLLFAWRRADEAAGSAAVRSGTARMAASTCVAGPAARASRCVAVHASAAAPDPQTASATGVRCSAAWPKSRMRTASGRWASKNAWHHSAPSTTPATRPAVSTPRRWTSAAANSINVAAVTMREK